MGLERCLIFISRVNDVGVRLFAVLDEVVNKGIRFRIVRNGRKFFLNCFEFGYLFRFDNEFSDECHLHYELLYRLVRRVFQVSRR